MLTIRCTACGRTYDYRRIELCPCCGAYNRPPHRVRIDSDGTIRAAAEAARPKPDTRVQRGRVKDGKLCYEQKECHENKTCYEESARRVRDGRGDGYKPESRQRTDYPTHETPPTGGGKPAGKGFWQGLESFADQQFGDGKPLGGDTGFVRQLEQAASKLNRGRNHNRDKTSGMGALLAVVIVLLGVLPRMVNSCQYNHVSTPEPWEEAIAIPVLDEKTLMDDMGIDAIYDIDESSFEWLGESAAVDSWTVEDDRVIVYVMGKGVVDGSDYCYLLTAGDVDEYGGYSYYTYDCTDFVFGYPSSDMRQFTFEVSSDDWWSMSEHYVVFAPDSESGQTVAYRLP